MASRYGNRDYGRGGRRGGGRGEYRASFEGRGFGNDPGDRSEYGREENYFGSGRQQYGGGYSGTGRTGRDMGEWSGDYNRGATGSTGTGRGYDWDDSERSSYQGGQRGISGSRGNYGRDRESYGNDEEYYNGPTGGMIGGGFGGYTGGGYQGYTGEQNRGGSRGGWSGYGGGNYGRGDYGGERDYERGNYQGRSSDYDRERGEDRGFFEKIGDEVSSWFGGDEPDRGRSHRGRGPRNYNRSDDRIREDLNDRLTDSHFIDASDIDVEVNNGEIILSGTVDSRYAKRMAEDIAEDISGVKNVENRIRVNRDWNNQSSNYSQTTTGAANTGNADLAVGSGTSGRTGTSGNVSGTQNTTGTSGTAGTTGSTGSAAPSGRGKGRSAGA
jgi:osmotically-inducible protein OsmY